MAVVAFNGLMKVSTNGSTFTAVAGVNSTDWNPKRDMLDTTSFNTGVAAKSKLPGLKDGSATFSGDMVNPDATGQDLIRAAYDNGTALYIQVLWDGTKGHSVMTYVSGYSEKAAVAGKVEFSATFEFSGLITNI